MQYAVVNGIDKKYEADLLELEAIVNRHRIKILLEKMIIKNKFHKGEI